MAVRVEAVVKASEAQHLAGSRDMALHVAVWMTLIWLAGVCQV